MVCASGRGGDFGLMRRGLPLSELAGFMNIVVPSGCVDCVLSAQARKTLLGRRAVEEPRSMSYCRDPNNYQYCGPRFLVQL